jgi:hypothetical protein
MRAAATPAAERHGNRFEPVSGQEMCPELFMICLGAPETDAHRFS